MDRWCLAHVRCNAARLPCAALSDAVGLSFATLTGRELAVVGLLAGGSAAAVVGLIGQWRSRRAWERRATELAADQVRQRRIIDGATDGIILTAGETGVILQANRAWRNCWASPRANWWAGTIRRSIRRKTGGDGAPLPAKRCSGAASGGRSVAAPRTGESIPVELQPALKLTVGVICRRPCSICGRSASPGGPARERARFRTLFENVPVAVIEKDYTAGRRLAGDAGAPRAWFDLRAPAGPSGGVDRPVCPRSVTAANRTALQRLGLPDVATYNHVMAERIPPQILRGVQRELEALWEAAPP